MALALTAALVAAVTGAESRAVETAPAVAAATPAEVPPRKWRLLVAYVAGNDQVSQRRFRAVHQLWSSMQTEYPRWSLRCLVVTGGAVSDHYRVDPVCPALQLSVADGYLALGHKVKAMLGWVSRNLVSASQPGGAAFDFLLKTDVDSLTCFSMVSDKLESLIARFGSAERVYLGHIETCSKIEHHPGNKFYDEGYMSDLLHREDAPCYPPYMQARTPCCPAALLPPDMLPSLLPPVRAGAGAHPRHRLRDCHEALPRAPPTPPTAAWALAATYRVLVAPATQGLGYVLSRDLVTLLGSDAMAPSLKVHHAPGRATAM